MPLGKIKDNLQYCNWLLIHNYSLLCMSYDLVKGPRSKLLEGPLLVQTGVTFWECVDRKYSNAEIISINRSRIRP